MSHERSPLKTHYLFCLLCCCFLLFFTYFHRQLFVLQRFSCRVWRFGPVVVYFWCFPPQTRLRNCVCVCVFFCLAKNNQHQTKTPLSQNFVCCRSSVKCRHLAHARETSRHLLTTNESSKMCQILHSTANELGKKVDFVGSEKVRN